VLAGAGLFSHVQLAVAQGEDGTDVEQVAKARGELWHTAAHGQVLEGAQRTIEQGSLSRLCGNGQDAFTIRPLGSSLRRRQGHKALHHRKGR